MITHCGFSSLFYWANGLAPVQHHNASLLTMVKTLGCHVCNTVPGCEVFLFMLANDAHVWAISLITTSVKTLVGQVPFTALHTVPLLVSGFWSAGDWTEQAITWANVDPDLCRHMASLGHNELTTMIERTGKKNDIENRTYLNSRILLLYR